MTELTETKERFKLTQYEIGDRKEPAIYDNETGRLWLLNFDFIDFMNELNEKVECYESILYDIVSQLEWQIGDEKVTYRVCSIVNGETYIKIKEAVK